MILRPSKRLGRGLSLANMGLGVDLSRLIRRSSARYSRNLLNGHMARALGRAGSGIASTLRATSSSRSGTVAVLSCTASLLLGRMDLALRDGISRSGSGGCQKRRMLRRVGRILLGRRSLLVLVLLRQSETGILSDALPGLQFLVQTLALLLELVVAGA